MTCIVGVADGGQVWMGGDSVGGGDGWQVRLRLDPKVHKVGEFLLGFTTSFRMGQLLAHAFTAPRRQIGQDVFAFMVAEFVPAVRRCFETGGWAASHNGVHEGGEFLVGHAGRLFCIHSDFQVAEYAEQVAAIGCGSSFALGAMWACGDFGAAERVDIGLKAAAHFSGGVRAPFTVAHLVSA